MDESERRRIEGIEFEKAMKLWVASPSKVRLAVFFRHNPGLVETLEGLATRLAIPAADLDPELRDHIQLGILRERTMGTTTVYAFDRARAGEIERMIQAAVASREASSR